MMSLYTKIFGDPNEKYIKSTRPLIEDIKNFESKYKKMSDKELKDLAGLWREDLKNGKSLDDLLPEVFAAAREAAQRKMGSGHFDCQMIGAKVLHEGKIAEMKTGEGKTSYAVSPAAALNALSDYGVHIVTVNDYLSKRDVSWIGSVYDALGLSVGVIAHEEAFVYDPGDKLKTKNLKLNGAETQIVDLDNFLRPVTRKEAYACDITYGTNNEFGFDYLRDNMVRSLEEKVQRGHHYAIIDEVDSILIDEARTPLIISAASTEATSKYKQFASFIPRLKEGLHYNIDEKMRAATLTEDGIKKMEELLGVDNIYTDKGMSEVHHIEQALKAHTLFQRDKDYVVKDGEIIIVDEFTGRLMYGRRYSDGLHQAIEAKEGVKIKQESVTMATITFQNYFRMYKKLSGMTGTAATEAEEFSKIYNLEVIVIPTNQPVVRIDHGDLIYQNEEAKFKAVIADIKERNRKGQPVLVGTISIEKNELFSHLLDVEGIGHNILNAKNHAKEAEIIAKAGAKGQVTLATNMAGRGVDIVLGGEGASRKEKEEVKNIGGLYVIGTERHESRRIDNQLRGRSGRQGDSGESRFYVSLNDDLMRVFGSDRVGSIMGKLGLGENQAIEHPMISKSLESAQKKVEGHNFDIRKHLVEYDDIINKHREVVYKRRDRILEIYERLKNSEFQIGLAIRHGVQSDGWTNPEQTLKNIIFEMLETEIEQVVMFHTSSDDETAWNIDEIYEVVDTIFPVSLDVRLKMDDIKKTAGDKVADVYARDKLINYLIDLAKKAYGKLEEEINKIGHSQGQSAGAVEPIREVEKMILLRSIDMLWVEHIDAMDYLRRGIGLRSYGQRDPLVEYKREAYQMFIALQNNIQKQVAYSIFKIGVASDIKRNERMQNIEFSGAEKISSLYGSLSSLSRSEDGIVAVTVPKKIGAISSTFIQSAPIEGSKQKVGRNDPCPCGSGKKFKKCHGQ
ncbi:preprotein translocase subunit SecA [Candidatus Kuenenbacteria bacterium CG08_land_8_20_14_0_20_37_23]|uniref:Protein translocase subunit SecA n=1 Tax=Candidatus Kuenenbacteria bacterium CG08_land_8_20_14_0_20_37_23 TaxID=1974617 RepID=A0A2M6XT08_9BACT|nr:MAG: preprotein translocase subunit SecA [Candidatus Kuenenbacteria bacterium CG08_land_8_20_14_0_20_37_23]